MSGSAAGSISYNLLTKVYTCLVPCVATTTVYGDCVSLCVCVCVCVYMQICMTYVFSQETFVRGTKTWFFISWISG